MALSDLANYTPTVKTPPGRKCCVCWAIETSSPADSAGLNAGLHNRLMPVEEIVKELRKDGYPVNVFSVNRHVRGGCAAREVCR